jgi:lipid-binding SYLF domain-containing protein
MKAPRKFLLLLAALLLPAGAAMAGKYDDTVSLFQNAGQSAAYFANCYGYAVFPTIGKGGLVIGGAHGTGHVYDHGRYIGNTSMNQVSVGLQAGGQAYSEIVFFRDKRALDEFIDGQYEFDAGVGAVAITAAAGGTLGTDGTSGQASGGKKDALTAGSYYKGMAVFTIVKGGAMYQATVAGQKFSFKPRANTVAQAQ